MENPKILHLNLKKKWFDMILSGRKQHEYREIKPYWIKRICWIDDVEDFPYHEEQITLELKQLVTFNLDDYLKAYGLSFKEFDIIRFKNGFARGGKPAPQFDIECKGITIDNLGTKEWGFGNNDSKFIIHLGEISNKINC